jgi:hypothetical protein
MLLHNYFFDFKAASHEAITKTNPVVKAANIDKLLFDSSIQPTFSLIFFILSEAD